MSRLGLKFNQKKLTTTVLVARDEADYPIKAIQAIAFQLAVVMVRTQQHWNSIETELRLVF